jgi:hypothetical protein
MRQSNVYLSELEQDYKLEMEGDEDNLSENELDALYEGLEDNDLQSEIDDDISSEYGMRFYELSNRSFESDGDRDLAINGLLNEMERDFFFKKMFKKLKKGGIKGVFKKALKVADFVSKIPGVGKMIPGLSTITQLARGNLKGALGSLAASGLNMLAPGSGAIAAPILAGIGLKEIDDPDTVNQEWWNRFAEVAQRSMENLADNITEDVDKVMEASQASSSAFRNAVSQVNRKEYTNGKKSHRNSKHITLHRGERVVIEVE